MSLPETNPQSTEPSKPFDAQTDRRIHEHLSNEHDVISEDDIRNIKTSIEGAEDESEDPKTPIVEYTGDSKLKDDLNPHIDNDSWDILDA